jgi:hypothetical protein
VCVFVGQTELLSELAGTARTGMMLLGPDDHGRWLRVGTRDDSCAIGQGEYHFDAGKKL